MLRPLKPDRRAWARHAVVVLTSLGLASYFAHHAVHGRHGLQARERLLERAPLLERELATLESRRARLAQEVALLGPEIPSRDLVEEIARKVLGYALPSEVVWIAR